MLGVLGGLTGSLGLGTIGGTVEITGPDLADAVAPLLAEPVQDAGGTLSLDLSQGSVRVDLAHLLGDDAHGLNDLPPNHEVVLDAVTLGTLADRLGQVVDAWAAEITTALTTALGSLHVRIALAADLSAPLTLGIRVEIATLSIGVDTGIAALMSGQTKLSVGVALLGLDLGGLLGVVTGLATSLTDPLTQAVVGTLTTRLFALVGTLGTTLTTTIGGPVVRASGRSSHACPGCSHSVSTCSRTSTRPHPRPAARRPGGTGRPRSACRSRMPWRRAVSPASTWPVPSWGRTRCRSSGPSAPEIGSIVT